MPIVLAISAEFLKAFNFDRGLTLHCIVLKISLILFKNLSCDTQKRKKMDSSGAQSEKVVGIEISNMAMKAVCLQAGNFRGETYQAALDRQKETAPQLVNFINNLRTKYGEFDLLGITVPGLLDRETKQIAYSARLPEDLKVDLLEELEKITKIRTYIENDANAAAYGEYVLGAGRGSRNMFYTTLGTGIGGAFVLNGQLWRGVSGFAGEFGYITINSDGMKLEDVASTANIIRRTKSRFHRDHTSSLNNVGEESITIADVVREANRGDDFAQLMLERTGMYIGTAIAGVINLLNIEKIVVGGEIMQAGHFVLDSIIQRARELSFAPSFADTEILEGRLGDNASAVGVALLAQANGS